MKKTAILCSLSVLTLILLVVACKKEDPLPKPVAYFTYSPTTNLVAPVTIYFSNTSENATSYLWETSDGQTSTAEDVTLTIRSGGSITMTLKATGKGGIDTYSRTITVANATTPPLTQPTAGFTYSPSSNLIAPATVAFTNTSTNATSYKWDFGDGTTSTTASPSKTFTSDKTYTVKLTATGAGGSAETSKNIVVGRAVATTTNPDTYFKDPRRTFSKYGESTAEEFTLSKTTTFTLYFASQYKAQAAIITDAELNNFKNMSSFQGYSTFDNQYGIHRITLSPGKYYVAVRNTNNGANITSLELDYEIALPASDRCNYYDIYINGAKSWEAGVKMWHGFTIQSGYRYFMDGCNTGFETYLIPENQLDNFKNGRQFDVYTTYTETTRAAPGFYEIKLAPGTYYFVGVNSTNALQSIVYEMQRWQLY